MAHTHYFAYGANMNEALFKARCPDSYFLCRAALPEHRFVVTSSGFATAVPEAGRVVHGVLIALAEMDEPALDRQEGVAAGLYRREWVPVVTELGYVITALIYLDMMPGEGTPKEGYLETILSGARRHGLPDEYCAEISRWGKAT